MESLKRLELNPAVGGLLLADNVQITQQQITPDTRTAVFHAGVILQTQKIQVQQSVYRVLHCTVTSSCIIVWNTHWKPSLWFPHGKPYKADAQLICIQNLLLVCHSTHTLIS